ncbi:QcrA and Rieske domain-containing protein [Sediminicola luteus]|uniref:(2Fe-2S)-binding protein n=1 Tax=Sediminicola luteus TaxID=319238 RepID=A0A2A4G8M7_9FLAO|nr:Rieske 2Fe-2S domain-containing protein [Sediminicola luteus]PCE64338.1 (2Fe-2S)-binding protein [Sediminicola luteus]
MERNEFLKTLGAGAAFALTFPCLHGCSSDSGEGEEGGGKTVPSGIDFTIDLQSSEGQQIAANGSFIIKNEVVVAKNLSGDYVAASQICSHQQTDGVAYNATDDIFRCSTHGARFSLTGTPLNSITSNPLKIFKTEVNGTTLRIFE